MSRPIDARLLRQAPACRTLLRVLGAQQVVAAMLTVAQAWLVADVIVAIFTHAGSVAGPLTALGIVAVARSAMAAAQEWTTARSSLRVRAQLRRATLVAAVRLGPGWVKRQQSGRVATATGPALDALDGYVTRALPALVGATVVPVVVLAAIAWSDWQSGLILLVLLPLVPLFMALVGFTTRRLVARQYAALARLAGQFLDLMRGLTTLRIYGRAAASETTVRRATEAYRKQTVATLRVAFLSGLVLDLLAALSVAVVAVDVGLRLDHGHIAFRTALLVLILAPELFAPLRALGVHHHATEEGLTAAAAALDIIDELPTDDAGTLPGIRPAQVYLDAVSVRYADRPTDALHEVSLALEPCSVTALTGPSGAGKSTLIAALLGFVTPTAGTVCAAGLPLGDRAVWRAGVAWLPQRPRPSQSTVGAEVRLGDPGAPDDVVAAACAQCRAPDPATPLGEDGSAVSAGERRRIALARALVRAQAVRAAGGVPLVLLDEPSEDLDAATASVVASVVDGMRGWATVLVATHNDELAAIADVRAELAGGRVVAVRQQRAARPPVPPEPALPARPAPAPRVTGGAEPYRLRDLVQAAGASRQLAVAAALSMLSAIAALALLATSMWLISRAAQHPNVQALAVAVVGVRTFAIARGVLRYFERMATHDAALRMLAALRVRVFAALRPLPPQVLGSYGRGDLLRRFVGDVDGAQEGLVRAVVPATGAVAGVVAAVVIAATLAPVAGAALAVAVLVGGLVVPVLAYRIAGDGAPSAGLVGARDRRCAALIDAMDELVAYGRADSAVDDVVGADVELARTARRPAAAAALGTFGTGVAAAGALVAVLAAAAGAARSGALPVVDVGVLAVCVLAAFEALAALPASWVAWARCRAGLRRVAEITGQSPAFDEPLGDVELPSTGPGLRVRELTLAPADGAAPVLDAASFDLERSTRLALVGSSGSGKSTLLAAAMRLLPSQRGSISVGTDAHAVDLRAMRAADVPPVIAGSLQGDHVFDATLRDNLRVVRPDAVDEALDKVASRAGLLGFIDTLPLRWSTPAGADGANLSGGQRQRLLLARALLADPDILVLDEPTAHLDADTEAAVLDDVLDATADRTVLLTTHRRLAAGRVDAVLEIVDRKLVGASRVLSEAGRTGST